MSAAWVRRVPKVTLVEDNERCALVPEEGKSTSQPVHGQAWGCFWFPDCFGAWMGCIWWGLVNSWMELGHHWTFSWRILLSLLSANFLPNRSTGTPTASPGQIQGGKNATAKNSRKVSLPEGPAGRQLQRAAGWTQGSGLPTPHTPQRPDFL